MNRRRVSGITIIAASIALALALGDVGAAQRRSPRQRAPVVREPVIVTTGTASGNYASALLSFHATWGHEYMLVVVGTPGVRFRAAITHSTMTREMNMSQFTAEILGRLQHYEVIAPPAAIGRVTTWSVVVHITNPDPISPRFTGRRHSMPTGPSYTIQIVDVTDVPPERRPGAPPVVDASVADAANALISDAGVADAAAPDAHSGLDPATPSVPPR